MNVKKVSKLKEVYAKRYGGEYINLDGHKYALEVVPTGSLMLDYKTGIGGFPYGAAVEVYAENSMGKSSAIGYPTLGNVQKQGRVVAVIQSEPRFQSENDVEWARSMGFEPNDALIITPDHANQAFDIMRDLVFDDAVDYIMIDSLGAMGTESSAKKDGKTKAYGISGLVTSCLNDIVPRMYHNNIGLLVLNQRRQAGTFQSYTLYGSPGGEGLHHQMRMRIELKPGRDRFLGSVDGESITVGREIKCVFVKNDMSKAKNKTATFNFFHIPTDEHPVGIDKASDVLNTAILTGVVKRSGAWFSHDSFPANIQGAANAGKFLLEHEDAYQRVREEVLRSMFREENNANAKVKFDSQETIEDSESDGAS